VSIAVRNTFRARSSEKALETAGTSFGWRSRHLRCGIFGRSIRLAGFDWINSSRSALSKIACRIARSRLIVEAPSLCSATQAATCRGRISPSLIGPNPSIRRA
jgi:hypothetical protein